MHIGKQTSETTYNESKTECLYVPTAKELNQRTIEMELSKDDILLLTAEEEEQSETQRMRRRKLEDKIYESSSETLPVEVEGTAWTSSIWAIGCLIILKPTKPWKCARQQ